MVFQYNTCSFILYNLQNTTESFCQTQIVRHPHFFIIQGSFQIKCLARRVLVIKFRLIVLAPPRASVHRTGVLPGKSCKFEFRFLYPGINTSFHLSVTRSDSN